MNPVARALTGALLGAVLTIVVHPVSRAYITRAFPPTTSSTKIAVAALPSAFPNPLPEPTSPSLASLWIHVSAERMLAGRNLDHKQVQALVELCDREEKADPANAFWSMGKTLFYSKLGREDLARQNWLDAAIKKDFDDYQNLRLNEVRNQLAAKFESGAWQYAYAFRLRSRALAQSWEAYAKRLVNQLSRESKEDLELRFATLINGSQLRDRSRNLDIMKSGVAIVEIASHPEGLSFEASPRRLLIAHSEFKESLRRAGFAEQADRVDRSYNENDAWNALTGREDTTENVSSLTLESSIWPSLPGVMLQCTFFGLVLWITGVGLNRLLDTSRVNGLVIPTGAALVLCISIWFLTDSWLALAASFASCLFLLLNPKSTRRQPPKDMGPLLKVVIFTLAMTFVTFAAFALLSSTLPVLANLSAFESQFATFANANLAAALALICLTATYLISPLWAHAQRVATLFVFSHCVRMMGTMTIFLALTLCVALTPICIFKETESRQTLKKLMENEPLYYLGQ
ncbi:MAG: hypothetical protein IT203_06415 [Fimbriimonadaceae bacterium]|nr:hypothetical protein [Fimbriimonadaceae bacterium]